MVEEIKRLLRLLTPIDWLSIGVVLLGLLIALLLDDTAVRLIGISIALLGALAFFLLISQRLSEEPPYSPALRSQAAQLRKTVRQEHHGTRLIFDDFAETFSEESHPSTGIAEEPSPAVTEYDEGTSSVRIVGRRPRRPAGSPEPSSPPEQKPSEPPPARLRTLSLPDFVLSTESPTEPRQAFRALLERIITLVRAVIPSHTAALFWLDSERQLLILETWQSELPELFCSEQRMFPLGRDIVSQVALDGRAEIVTEIQPSAELELLPYYRQGAGTASFVGVPILLHSRPVGVLCLDSPHPQAYTATTVSLLGHVVLLIGGLLQNYIEHYELLQQNRAWESARRLWQLVVEPESSFADQLLALWAAVVPAPVLALCLYQHPQRRWAIAALRAPQAWHHLLQAPCVLEQTLLGEALYNGAIRQWVNSACPYRLHPQEPPLMEHHSAYAIPFCSPTHVYGALYCELSEPLAPQELKLAETLSLWTGTMLEHRYWSEQLRSGLWFHADSGLWTHEGFRFRLAEELERVRLLGGEASLGALRIDRYETLSAFPASRLHDLLLAHVLPLLRSNLRGCDLIGSLNSDLLGILLPGMELTQAQLWAEQLRRQIATTVFAFEQHRLSLTVSIGLTSLRRHRDADEALRAALTALEKASQKGNTVTPYA